MKGRMASVGASPCMLQVMHFVADRLLKPCLVQTIDTKRKRLPV